jgi:predicted hydrocarbon binding protein
MAVLQKSGFYYPNKLGLIALRSLEEVMGKSGLRTILDLAGLSRYADTYPPDNLQKEVDFAEISAIGQALETMYGPRGGRGLALKAGRATFPDTLRQFGALVGVADLTSSVLPLQAKLRIGLNAFAQIFDQLTDQKTGVEERGGDFIWTIYKCPYCWGRHGEQQPVCYTATGLLQESLRWLSGVREFRVQETACIAMGDQACSFLIHQEPMS